MTTKTQMQWLASFGHTNIKPIKVKIQVTTKKTVVCDGAEYQSKHFDGKRLMLLTGEYKAITNRKCFTRDDSDNEWFVAGYATPELALERPEQNPFGPSIIVSAWDVGGKIDQYENKEYKRLPMEVEYI